MEELYVIADKLREVMYLMDKQGDPQICSKAYHHADHALSDVLAVITKGEATAFLQYKILADNPEMSTEDCIRLWEESYGGC